MLDLNLMTDGDLEARIAECRALLTKRAHKRAAHAGATEIQAETFAFMRAFLAVHGMPPTLREMATHFGLASLNAISQRMREMQKKGLVVHTPKISRGWMPA